MARNLQAKLPPTDNIRLFDINTAAAERLAQEMTAQAGGARAHVSESAASASQHAVCYLFPLLFYTAQTPKVSMMSLSKNDISKLGPSVMLGASA